MDENSSPAGDREQENLGMEREWGGHMDCPQGHGTAEEQADLYSKEYAMFWNDADIQAMTLLAHALQHANLCNRDHVVLIGGVNEGQLAEKLLQQCRVCVCVSVLCLFLCLCLCLCLCCVCVSAVSVSV